VNVTVLFFAQARERAGLSSITLELPSGSRVRDALDAVEHAYPGVAELRPHLAVAVDRELAAPETALADGAELALLPPVSGG